MESVFVKLQGTKECPVPAFLYLERNLQSLSWLRERTGLRNEAGISTAPLMLVILVLITIGQIW